MNGKNLHTNVVPLPKNDPYEEIYKADGVWWEMVKDELVDPAKLIKKDNPNQRSKDVYFKKIEKVKEFHWLINFSPTVYCSKIKSSHCPQLK